MGKSSFSENITVIRIRELLKREGIPQCKLADDIDRDAKHFSRDMCSGKVSEKTCRKIIEVYPDYNLEWLLGISDKMLKKDLNREYVKNIDDMNQALSAVLEGALREVCARENLNFSEELSKFGTNPPLWIYESLLLQEQLRSFAIGLVWNYVKYRDNDQFWNTLDSLFE